MNHRDSVLVALAWTATVFVISHQWPSMLHAIIYGHMRWSNPQISVVRR